MSEPRQPLAAAEAPPFRPGSRAPAAETAPPPAPADPAALHAFLDLPCAVKEVVGVLDLPDALEARPREGAASRLTPLEGLCQACPARLEPEPFTCRVYLPLPLQPEVEEWVLALLPDNLGSTAGRLVRACFETGPFDGRRVLGHRRNPRLFATRVSALREWRGTGTYLTSEQVLEPLLFNDAILPGDTVKLCLLFGLLDPDTPLDRARRAVLDPGARRALLGDALVPEPPADLPPAAAAQARALVRLFEAVRQAGRLDVPLACLGV